MKHVIIGVGAAGITAAKTIRSQQPDASITMVSTDEHVHSRCMLHRYLSHERQEDTLSFVEPDFFESNHIDWIKGVSVKTIDVENKEVLLDNNTSCRYDKLLITTGANSFIPPVGQFREANNVFGSASSLGCPGNPTSGRSGRTDSDRWFRPGWNGRCLCIS